jgi:hypothetical protein
MTPDVLQSPALPLLLELEADGFDLRFDGSRLLVKPIERLSPERRALVAAHRADLVALVRICDAGVVTRRQVFAAQYASGVTVGRFALVPDLPYVSGRCFSCGDPLTRPAFGRCWRCAMAWRLVVGVPVSASLSEVYDTQRMVA